MQLEYAQKGIQQAETVIGVVCSDGVIIASEKIKHSRLQSKNSDRRIFSVDSHVSVCICGWIPDGMSIVEYAKKECEAYRKNYGVPITGLILTERLAVYVHMHTLYGQLRPLGCEIFISSFDEEKF